MLANLPSSVRIEAHRLFDVPDAARVRIRCEEGSVWVTIDDDPRDVILAAGESFETREHRRVLVYALEDARVGLARRAHAAAAPAVAQWMRSILRTGFRPS